MPALILCCKCGYSRIGILIWTKKKKSGQKEFCLRLTFTEFADNVSPDSFSHGKTELNTKGQRNIAGKIELVKKKIKEADVCQGEPLRLQDQRCWPNKSIFVQVTLAEGE